MERRGSAAATNADDALAKMGYKAELPRSLSMLSVLGLSFAIMAVPYGLSTTFYITLVNGQSVTILWGWVLISLINYWGHGTLENLHQPLGKLIIKLL